MIFTYFSSQLAAIHLNLNNSHHCKTFVMIHSAAHFYHTKIKSSRSSSVFFGKCATKNSGQTIIWMKLNEKKNTNETVSFQKMTFNSACNMFMFTREKKIMTVIAWHKSYNGQRTENRDGDIVKMKRADEEYAGILPISKWDFS